MKTKTQHRSTVLLFVLFSLMLLLAGCSGGGGSGSGSVSSGGSGGVALYIKDAPADDYENIYIYIEEVSLISADKAQSPVVIFKSSDPGGYEIDLLDLRDQDMLFTIKKDVPARLYEKIRLKIKDIYPIPKPDTVDVCDKANMEIKLPSGKIDLNPRGGIHIKTGQTLSIRLDIDANKSINIHPAGKSGKCIFRPVVFVDIEPVSEKPQISCLRLLKGTIGELLYRESSVVGFTLDLPGNRGPLKVYIPNAVIFDENGLPMVPADLVGKVGSQVNVRGKLDENARFHANMVVLGQVLVLKGIVGDTVDPDSQFPLNISSGQAFVGTVTVGLSPESLLLISCDQTVDPTYIQKDMLVRVVGKYNTETQILQAVALFLQPVQVVGTLDGIRTDNGINIITIGTENGSTVDVVLPKNVPPMLEGDGIIPDEIFECAIGKGARVMLDPEQPLNPTALEVRIQPETIDATVIDVFTLSSTIEATDSNGIQLAIHVEPTATILKFNSDPLAGAAYTPIPLYKIKNGDHITVYALAACKSATDDYSAFIILASSP
jgi:hypothetical protein